jgi:hypothetical protein
VHKLVYENLEEVILVLAKLLLQLHQFQIGILIYSLYKKKQYQMVEIFRRVSSDYLCFEMVAALQDEEIIQCMK